MRVLARIGKPEDGAHTHRGVHGILGLTIGCVWGACTVTFNSSASVGPDWEAGVVRTLVGECTASLADHGVCVGLWRTSSDVTSRLFAVHRTEM